MNILDIFGFRKDKPENDRYWEFDKEKHYRPKLNKGDFFKLTRFDFGWFVLEPLSKYIENPKYEIQRGKHLSYGQKALYYWWYVDAEVKNGGFLQYYYNDYGKYTLTIIKALQYIGDLKMAELVNRSYEVYQKELSKIKKARNWGLVGFSNLYEQVKGFEALDDEYYKLDKVTMKHIEKFIRKNPNEFCIDEEGKEFDLNFSGEIKTFYSNNQLKEVFTLQNGIINGEFKSYYENKSLKESINYIEGEQTGERIEFFENGNKKYSIRKDLSKNQFEHLWFYENGNPKELEHKLLDIDERIGEYKEWYENGQISKQGTYISDHVRDGQWLEYHKDGKKKVDAEFKDGAFLIHSCWNEKGDLILSKGTGWHIYEYSIFKGQIDKKEHEYKDYKRHGKQYSYRNGILSLYQEMKDGKEHGVTKFYDDKGNLEGEILFEEGKEVSRKEYKKGVF